MQTSGKSLFILQGKFLLYAYQFLNINSQFVS